MFLSRMYRPSRLKNDERGIVISENVESIWKSMLQLETDGMALIKVIVIDIIKT